MRKKKLTCKIVERAIALKKDGFCDTDIIDALDVHQSTFYRWLKELDTELKRALREGLKKAEVEYKQKLLITIRDAALSRSQFWTAAAWLFEREYLQEYGKAERKLEEETTSPVQLTLGIEVGVCNGDD